VAEYQHLVDQKGRYQLVALTTEPLPESGEVLGYALVTASGAKIWQDLTLSEGRMRLDSIVASEPDEQALLSSGRERGDSTRITHPRRHSR
jgi:hypothetical protein